MTVIRGMWIGCRQERTRFWGSVTLVVLLAISAIARLIPVRAEVRTVKLESTENLRCQVARNMHIKNYQTNKHMVK
jgi:hypothetical protein